MKSKRVLMLLLAVYLGFSACDYKPRNQGRAVYKKHCENCHLGGEGLGALIPPVANSDYVLEHKDALACIIRNGMSGVMEVNGVEFEGEMPGNLKLSEVEITNLIHYILVDLNGQENPFSHAQVKEMLSSCK